MESLGTVVEILNEDAVLIRSDQELPINLNGNLIVFSRVSLPQLKEKYGLEFLDFRKGEIVVSWHKAIFMSAQSIGQSLSKREWSNEPESCPPFFVRRF